MAKIVIVGGGVAGLSAGIYSRMAGHDVVICERHFLAGGNLTGWSRGGYHIDNCIHWLTGTNENSSLYRMWCELGALGEGVNIVQESSLFSCERGGVRVSLPPSLSELRDNMLAVSPEDRKEIDRLVRAIDFIAGADNIAGEGCNEGMTAKRLLSGLGPIMIYYSLTTGQLAGRFKNPALRCFITGFWGDDFSAVALIFVFATFCQKNGALPEGGSVKMAERMTDKFLSLGGRLRLKCEALRVNLEGNRAKSVSFADGSVLEADYVILTTDPAVTFGKMVDLPMPKKLQKYYDNHKMRRFSAYHFAYAVDSESLPFVGDLIFDVPEKYVGELGTKQLIVRGFSHEPRFAPEGKNIIQTLTFCFDEGAMDFIRLRESDKEGYSRKKERLAGVLQELIEEHCSTLRGKLRLIDGWTPATYNRFVNSEMGSFMSFAIPEKHLPIAMNGIIEGYDNIILATQWQQSPGGLPIAASSGKWAAERIIKLENRK